MSGNPNIFDDPDELARKLAAAPRPLLVGLDIDGVLAPIVARAEQATLTPGVLDAIGELGTITPVVVVSGRDLGSIERVFEFPSTIPVIGSHGIERRDRPLRLDDGERDRLAQLTELTDQAAARAGDGAWAEHKPNGAALHVRGADRGRSLEALTWLEHAVDRINGASGKAGHEVYETMARPASKAIAVEELRAEMRATTVAFVGDDATDEDVFRSLEAADYSIRVGNGDSAARHRLADPTAVLTLLRALRSIWD